MNRPSAAGPASPKPEGESGACRAEAKGEGGARRAEAKGEGGPAWRSTLSVGGELIERLNTGWKIEGPPLSSASVRQRLASPFRRVLARFLAPQETFNATLVQYINELTRTQEATLDHWEDALDEVERYREAVAARERRMEASLAAIRKDHEELRTSIGVLQQAAHQIRRDVSRLGGAGDVTRASVPAQGAAAAGAPVPAASHALGHHYVGFEDQFRGTAEAIRAGLADYVSIFAGRSNVLDIGCGRGEFLMLLREHGIPARGIDLNDAMVEVCRDRGVIAETADALAYLQAQPDASLGGLFAAQVVEHLEPAYLTALLDAAFGKLQPDAPIVLETINPACWFAFFESYIRDITHVRALHSETLEFLLVATGFQQVEVRFKAPYPEHEKLQPIAAAGGMADVVETLNANVEKINRLLFTYLDYAVIGKKP